MTVGLVLVSHSAALAEGVAELACQMAPRVVIAAAGGADEGGLGTSMEKVVAALEGAETGDGVVVLYDLGSARMTGEMALELLDDERRTRTRLVDAPLVEGAVAAATTAEGGGDVDAVAAAAGAAGTAAVAAAADGADGNAGIDAGPAADAAAEIELVNPLGLHARSAAKIPRALRGLDAEVTVARADTGASANGRSVLALAALDAQGGTGLRITATGDDAAAALARVLALVRDGFGEREGAPG